MGICVSVTSSKCLEASAFRQIYRKIITQWVNEWPTNHNVSGTASCYDGSSLIKVKEKKKKDFTNNIVLSIQE